jgi:pimeloyl-ACP methyl ester carboxylesterase
MSTITTKDGTQIYYKDWGKGPVVTFAHGWPLSSDAWDGQMLFLAQNGFRVVAHDRRRHGRSAQVSSGNDMNGYESIKAFSETDQTEDLKKFDVPTLVMHGEDDLIVPVKDSAKKAVRLIEGAKGIYYPGAPHGLTATHQFQVNADLLAFLKG